MFEFSITETTGYVASLLILLSFLMKDMKRLRVMNTVGCSFFVAYGVLLHFSWPIIITNVSIVVINIYFLVKPDKG